MCPREQLCEDVHDSFTANTPEMETAQVSISGEQSGVVTQWNTIRNFIKRATDTDGSQNN